MFRRSWSLVFCTILVVSCKKGNDVPSYVQLSPARVTTDTLTQYSGSHSIEHGWVFANDDALGVWQIPSRLPVLKKGSAVMKIIAGVKRNGSASEFVQYPFYATFDTLVDLSTSQAASVTPRFEYFDGLGFWNEAFEDIGISFLVSATSDTGFVRDTDPEHVFEGDASGAIHLDAAHPFFQASTSQDFDVANNNPVFLEVNYRSDHRFLVGATMRTAGTLVREPYLFVAPSRESDGAMPWKKIYIDLSPVMARPFFTDKELFIEVQKLSGQSEANIWLDNIKLVYYEP